MSSAAEEVRNSEEFYCDELNFAEFPLAALGKTVPRGQKTLEFTDSVFDKSRNAEVVRKLSITAADKYGLPTAMDDEVVLGLIQLTARTDFSTREVYFTRYELLRLLGWSDDSRNYARLEQSLKRWLGVTLYYENSWWSREEQSWVNEGFHVLDYVQIFDRERRSRSRTGGKSMFVWNDVVFRSFKAGYLKRIDFDFYKSLSSAIAKRIFRFLDKRFYQQMQVEFDLRTFACEHLGLSRKYHNGELKRVLTPAISELEKAGFLRPFPAEKRFVRQTAGAWRIVFARAGKGARNTVATKNPLVEELVKRGVSTQSAERLVATTDEACVRERLALFDWLVARKDRRVARSPAGFLYRSIAENFTLPEDYLAATAQRKEPKNTPALKVAKTHADEDGRVRRERAAIDRYWNALSEDERIRIERDLVIQAAPFLRERYREREEARGPFFNVLRQTMIDKYVREQLAAAAS